LFRKFIAFAAVLTVSGAAAAFAAGASAQGSSQDSGHLRAAHPSALVLSTPTALAAAIEARADKTSFAELERFGDEALRLDGRERLNRLHHVAWIFLNQSEFGKFEHWNGVLRLQAQRTKDSRYVTIARVDELFRRFSDGDSAVTVEIAHIAANEPDWFARTHAMSVYAQTLSNQEQSGDALKILADAQTLVPENDRWARASLANIWESRGLVLMGLSDLQGSTAAFAKVDFEYSDGAYPRPDYDDIYNMSDMAVKLGDQATARQLAAIHHRLSMRADLPNLKSWDIHLCSTVAEGFGTPAEVMDCLRPLDAELTNAQFLATTLLPQRAIAEARLGRIAEAETDLARLRKLKASNAFGPASFAREPQIEAELLLARGHPAEAFAKLREFDQVKAVRTAKRFNGGVRQITAQLMGQLDTQHRNMALQADVIRGQEWFAAIAAMFVLLAGAALVWQRHAAKNLKLAREKAETANRTKSEFLANMSHEIRTPLNGVVGVADLLALSDLPPREKEMVELVRSSGKSLERLLSDVLDLARVEAGQLTIEAAPFHVGELARAVAALSRLKADETGLALECSVSPEAERWVSGDATRVRQIITNLVSNAVKFTARGKVSIHVTAPTPGRLRFEVADTGLGFDAAEKERLFRRFQQADGSITRRFGGSGLGLAISRQLAELMDGEFDCESTPNVGSRFWFEAPFAPAEAPGARTDLNASRENVADRPLRVLLADDHPTNQIVVRMMLDQFGIETVTVDNGAEALHAMEQDRFDVVLMDMQMPVMDGLQATREIRRREASGHPRTPVIMLSANALTEHQEASRAAGADLHLSKPITVADLSNALETVLATAGADSDVEAAA
jgi:signal transduction histidine kinase/AmiR/NasT family two-component response regulator